MNGIDLSLISVIVGLFIGLGTLIAGCGFAYAQFKTGGDKVKEELIDTLKESLEVEKQKSQRLTDEKTVLINSHQQQINSLNERIGKLQGLYEASEQSKKDYLAILQGRDPSSQKFMELLTQAAVENNKMIIENKKYMSNTTAILSEIRTFMKNLNKNTTKSSQFLGEVDEATKTG